MSEDARVSATPPVGAVGCRLWRLRAAAIEPVIVLPSSVPGAGRPSLLPPQPPVRSAEPPGRGRLPLAARRPACAASSRAWDSPPGLEPGRAAASAFQRAICIVWHLAPVKVGTSSKKDLLVLVLSFFVCFQHGSLQPRTSVRSVPGDAEREQAFQRLQLQNVCCQEDKRCLPRK